MTVYKCKTFSAGCSILWYHVHIEITSAQFVKGVVGVDTQLEDGKPHVVFIGRSNVGKSSVINALTKQKGLARTSSFPGCTQQINVYLINKTLYLLDLPGYGYAKASKKEQEKIQYLIFWYLLDSHYQQKKVVVIIDAYVGLTANDIEMINRLEEKGKRIVVVANKIDKVKSSERERQLNKIRTTVEVHKVIPCSTVDKVGIRELKDEILSA